MLAVFRCLNRRKIAAVVVFCFGLLLTSSARPVPAAQLQASSHHQETNSMSHQHIYHAAAALASWHHRSLLHSQAAEGDERTTAGVDPNHLPAESTVLPHSMPKLYSLCKGRFC